MHCLIRRTQQGIGQGGFHTASIRSWAERFGACQHYEYVFDCGTYSAHPDGGSRQSLLEERVDNYLPHEGIVDAVFMSHFDEDHHNGIKTLASKKIVRRIYLPYATPEEVWLFLAGQVGIGAPVNQIYAQELMHALSGGGNPYGSVEIIRVGGPLDDGPSNIEANPRRGDFDSRLREVIVDHKGANFPINGKTLPMGISVGLIPSDVRLPWILRPWNYKQSEKVRNAALNFLVSLGLVDLFSDSTVTQFAIDLLFRNKARILKSQKMCLKEEGGKYINNNAISMCLYSGPDVRLWAASRTRAEYRERGSGEQRLRLNPPGWISTGDARLNHHWDEFEKCFSDVLKEVGTYVVPHHGSKHNHEPALLSSVPGRLAIICAGYGHKHHPSELVLKDIFEIGDCSKIVTEHWQEGLAEELELFID